MSEVKLPSLIPPLACEEVRFLDAALVFLNRFNSNELLVFILVLQFCKRRA